MRKSKTQGEPCPRHAGRQSQLIPASEKRSFQRILVPSPSSPPTPFKLWRRKKTLLGAPCLNSWLTQLVFNNGLFCPYILKVFGYVAINAQNSGPATQLSGRAELGSECPRPGERLAIFCHELET